MRRSSRFLFVVSLPFALAALACSAGAGDDPSGSTSEQALDPCKPTQPSSPPRGTDPSAEADLACPGPGLTAAEAARAFVQNDDHTIFGSSDRIRKRQCVGATCSAWSSWEIYARSSFSGLRNIALDLSNGKTTALLHYGDGNQNVSCLATTSCSVDAKGSVACEPMQFPVVGANYAMGRYLGTSCQGVTTDGDAALVLSGKLTSTCAFLSGRIRRPGTGGGVVETEIAFNSGATMPDTSSP